MTTTREGDAPVDSTARPEYGFYGRLQARFPSQIIVDSTEVCNLECIHCAHPSFKRSEHYAGRSLDPSLNVKLVDEVSEWGRGRTQYLRYSSNGEPLIHPKIFEMLTYAVERSGVRVALTTNGTLLDDARTESLLDTGVHVVDVSIDAHLPETYARVRVKGDLSVTRANVHRLLDRVAARGTRTRVVVSYIEQPENAAETADFERYWKEAGADYVVVRRLHSNAGAMPGIAASMRKETPPSARRPCVYPWERLVLNSRGFIAFCPADWTHGSTIPGADYRAHTIRDLWQGEFYRGLREAHLRNAWAGFSFCGQCPDWKETRWPDEGRAYADMIEEFKDLE